MRIMVVEPYRTPYIKNIQGTLEEMQEIVGGYIEVLHPHGGELTLVCNEEGRLLGLTENPVEGLMEDVVGTFFLCSSDPEEGELKDLSMWECIMLRRLIYMTGGPRVLRENELFTMGIGWMECSWDPEEEEPANEDECLLETIWMDGKTLEKDCTGCVSMGDITDLTDYNRRPGRRMWTQKPTKEQREALPWETEDADDAEGVSD